MLPRSDKKVLLSVITPVTALANNLHNLSSWLIRIIDKPIEVILIHDKSDIHTGPQLKKIIFEAKNPNVIYIEDEFGSPGLARNEGLKLVSGEWVCFWDADDLPILDEIFLLFEKKFDSGIDCIVASYISIDLQTSERIIHRISERNQVIIGLNPGLWRFIFRKTSLSKIKFTDLLMAEDQVFLAEYLSNKRIMHISSEITYTYFKGNLLSLTNNKFALNDLGKSSKYTLQIMNRTNDGDLLIIGVMLARQVISGIKHGNLKCKIFVILNLIRGIILSKNKTRKNLLNGFYINVFKDRFYEN